uniref:Macaca fascicularis brain cDNA clone: QflA-18788, similar to human apoptotic protease activating factor (APAF1), transcriptvariant 5, mRNA, RefSeq: NM_181869.1 n=1 Tax=Macaca fascicularis TaxID=9541 RepID=I7GIC0_MACFA|nr:unnamed protein product [Macaca fascicularis]
MLTRSNRVSMSSCCNIKYDRLNTCYLMNKECVHFRFLLIFLEVIVSV